MATTEIHAVKTTPKLALQYIMSDKIVPYEDGMEIWGDCPSEIIEKTDEAGNLRKFVRYATLSSFSDCNSRDPMETYNRLRERFQGKKRKSGVGAKGGEPLLWHAHQSFAGREVDPVTANRIGLELARTVFKGFPVTISTHTDGANIHNHFMISAWNMDGKKWNDHHESYRKFRQESDRLCRENNLSVLANTEEQVLIQYTDANGQIHYFEPTDRKIELIRQRENGNASGADVNSYLNTEQHKRQTEKALSNQEIIQRDMDALIPVCRSFDELLSRLRGLGYTVNDKRKNGEWLAHISYQPPEAFKPTRESRIGDGVSYTRERLTALFAERGEMEKAPDIHPPKEDIPYFPEYEYGVTDIDQINDDWRMDKNEFGVGLRLPRSDREREVITDIRKADREVKGLIDTTKLRQIIQEQNTQKRNGKPYLTKTQEQRLVARINHSFQCLRYAERHGIYSPAQILALYRETKRKYDEISIKLGESRTAINGLREVLLLPGKAEALKQKINAGAGDVSYQMEQQQTDARLLKVYRTGMEKYGLNTPDGVEKLTAKVTEFQEKQIRLEQAMQNMAYHMAELDNCMRVYHRIDGEMGRAENAAWEAYVMMLKQEKESEQSTEEENRRGQKKERDER